MFMNCLDKNNIFQTHECISWPGDGRIGFVLGGQEVERDGCMVCLTKRAKWVANEQMIHKKIDKIKEMGFKIVKNCLECSGVLWSAQKV